MANCPLPPHVSRCPPITTYSIGGAIYVMLQLCDSNGKLLAVYQLCDGIPTGTPSYYDLTGAAYTPVGTPRDCSSNPGDVEQSIFCDNATDPPTPFIARVRWDDNGDLVPDQTGTYGIDGVTPYTPTGTISVCGGDVIDSEFAGPLCEKDAAGDTVGYVFHKIFYRGQVQVATALAGYKLAAPNVWIDPYVVGAGNTLDECSPGSTIKIVCRCDDADADGVGEISYKEIISISNSGVPTLLSTYNRTLTAVYAPVSPVDCSVPGDNLVAARARYKVVSGPATWVLGADSVLPTSSVAVAVVAVGSVATPPTMTDAGGSNSLFSGQSLSWSTQFARNVSGLRTPLVFTANAGDILTVSWVEESV